MHTGDSIGMITASGECQFGPCSVSAEGGCGNLIFVHESDDIVGHLFHVERLVLIGGTEVTLVQNVHVTVVQNLILINSLCYL